MKTMLDYINDQPRMLKEIYEKREVITKDICEVFKKYPIRKVILIGAGTSNYVSMAFKYYIDQYLPLDAQVSTPTTFAYYEKVNKNGIYKKSEILIIAFSQTGTSINTVKALKAAKQDGWHTAVLTAVPNSAITQYADYIFPLICGTEQVPPETRGFTSAVLTVYLWTLYLAQIYSSLSKEEVNQKLKHIKYYTENVQQDLLDCKKWFDKNEIELMQLEKGAVTGYGIHYITALEGNLKLAETFRKPICSYEMEEFIHGPNMAYGKTHYLFLMLSNQKERERANDVIGFFEPVTEHMFLITDKEENRRSKKDMVFSREFPIDLAILPYVMVFQVYAALACIKAGIDTSVFPFDNNGIAHDD